MLIRFFVGLFYNMYLSFRCNCPGKKYIGLGNKI